MAAPPILLVADDLSVIASVKRVLAREGYECVLATSAADAVIAFGHLLPGLLVLQPSVEGERGGVLLEELQGHPDARLLRVLLLGETLPGYAWPVVPLPLDPEYFATALDENIRTTDEGSSWSVLETSPAAGQPTAVEPAYHSASESDVWRATSPGEVDPQAPSSLDEVPEPQAIVDSEPEPGADLTPAPTPPPAAAGHARADVPDALEEKLFDDLAADVEASAMQSVESSLPRPIDDDDELSRLEGEVRAEAHRRRQSREARAVTVRPAEEPPPPTELPSTQPEGEDSFDGMSEMPAAPPSRAVEVLSRAEQMVIDGRAQSEAQQRANDADARALREEAATSFRRAQEAAEQLQAEREARRNAEEQLLKLRDELASLQAEFANERELSRVRFENELESLKAELDAAHHASASHVQTEAMRRADTERLLAEEAELARLQLEQTSAQLQHTEQHLAEAQAAREAAQRELLAIEEVRDALQVQLTEAQGRMEGLHADVTSASALLEDTARERDTLRARIATLESYQPLVEKLSAELDAETQRRSALEAELDDARRALDSTRTHAQSLEATAVLAGEKVKALEAREVMSLVMPGKRTAGIARHGSAELDGLSRVVCQLVMANAEVRLELGATGGTRNLWFKRGQIIAAESSLEHEGLITRARRDGLIDSKQEAELRMLKGATPREQLEALKTRGFIRDIESVPLVQRYTEQVALDAFTEEKTLYRVVEEAPRPEVLLATVPRPTLPMLAESLRRAVAPDVMLERLGGGEAVPAATDSELDLRALGFSERERKMLTWVDGEATIEDLSLASGLKPDLAFRALLVAQLLGIIEVRPGQKKTESGNGQLDLQRLEAKFDEVQDADYFTILGLSRAAGTEDVRRAYQRLTQEFDPLRFSGHPDPAIQQRAQVVANLLEEAARALEDDRRRVEYARHLLD